MIYNEPEYLKIWSNYYGRQVGIDNCFVIDHGSDDECTNPYRFLNIIRTPRSPQDEERRVKTISDFVGFLLHHYDVVLYTDVDEILVPNPNLYRGLKHFCEEMKEDVVTAIGLNVHHLFESEEEIDIEQPILIQRPWVRMVSPMCKPLITKRPIIWGRGFHSSDYPTIFGEIYLFHLRYFDLNIGLRRLKQTRNLARRTKSDEAAAAHQRLEDHQFTEMMRAIANMEKVIPERFSLSSDPIHGAIDTLMAENRNCRIRLDFFSSHLWWIPQEFKIF
jgi:hypothetical protein